MSYVTVKELAEALNKNRSALLRTLRSRGVQMYWQMRIDPRGAEQPMICVSDDLAKEMIARRKKLMTTGERVK